MGSPTQRSLKLMRERGYSAAVTEKWNPHAKIRQDLFGFIDLVAIAPDIRGVIGIQTTSHSNRSARIKKIFEIPEAKTWLKSGNYIQIHGWKKVKNRWACSVQLLSLDDGGNYVVKESLES